MWRGLFRKAGRDNPFDQPEARVSDRVLTVSFTVLHRFDLLAATHLPRDLAALLHRYYTLMADIVRDHHGMVCKFFDGTVMSAWGLAGSEPDHASLACASALRQVDVLQGLAREGPDEQGPGFPLDVGIGISTGMMVVGIMGSSKRLSYSVLGDEVNLASRLSGVTTMYYDALRGVGHFSRILLAEETYDQVKHRTVARELDAIRVRGKQAPAAIYELIDMAEGFTPPRPPAKESKFQAQSDPAPKLMLRTGRNSKDRKLLAGSLAQPLSHSQSTEREMTFLVSDILGFSGFSEQLPPDAIRVLLDRYRTVMAEVIRDYQGTLEQFVGDAIRCLWGAPVDDADHALHACACALKMQQVLTDLNTAWPAGQRIATGIGISTGPAVCAFLGPPDNQVWAPVGASVYLAERLFGVGRIFTSRITIGERTRELLDDRAVVREIDTLRLNEHDEPMSVYELIDLPGGVVPPRPVGKGRGAR
jgi:class 3 adenylate cyclase